MDNWPVPKIGDWVTICCEHDLTQIRTEEEIRNVEESMRDCFICGESNPFTIYNSLNEAKEALRDRHDSLEFAAIFDRLAEEELAWRQTNG